MKAARGEAVPGREGTRPRRRCRVRSAALVDLAHPAIGATAAWFAARGADDLKRMVVRGGGALVVRHGLPVDVRALQLVGDRAAGGGGLRPRLIGAAPGPSAWMIGPPDADRRRPSAASASASCRPEAGWSAASFGFLRTVGDLGIRSRAGAARRSSARFLALVGGGFVRAAEARSRVPTLLLSQLAGVPDPWRSSRDHPWRSSLFMRLPGCARRPDRLARRLRPVLALILCGFARSRALGAPRQNRPRLVDLFGRRAGPAAGRGRPAPPDRAQHFLQPAAAMTSRAGWRLRRHGGEDRSGAC